MKRFIEFARCYAQGIADDQIGMRAAALAYFAVFSIFPLALLVISAIGFFLDDPERQQQVLDAISKLLPEMTQIVVEIAEGAMDSVVRSRNLSGFIAIIGLLWSASGFFRALEFSVQVIFGIGAPRPLWKSRGVGMLLVLLVTPILLVTVALISFSSLLVDLPFIPEVLKTFLSVGISQILTLLLSVGAFFLLYRFVPNRWTPVRPAVSGASVAGVAWMVLTYGFNWYLQSGFANYNVLYGSIGAVIALIFYLYLANYVVLLGAELVAQLGATKECTPMPLPPVVEEYIENNM
jgi:membrane protein